ncbi:MAG: hypothetical protein M1819_006681 [Sarea resinae]|nr:MAG: hypothetical protein M1819_006681 [Sarea resinae]
MCFGRTPNPRIVAGTDAPYSPTAADDEDEILSDAPRPVRDSHSPHLVPHPVSSLPRKQEAEDGVEGKRNGDVEDANERVNSGRDGNSDGSGDGLGDRDGDLGDDGMEGGKITKEKKRRKWLSFPKGIDRSGDNGPDVSFGATGGAI